MWRQNLFCLRRRTLAGGLVSSREQESRVLWLESQQPASSIFPTISRHGSGVLYFSVVGQLRLQQSVAHAASCDTQRASPVNAHMGTCQRDGADLSPANLSCPGVHSQQPQQLRVQTRRAHCSLASIMMLLICSPAGSMIQPPFMKATGSFLSNLLSEKGEVRERLARDGEIGAVSPSFDYSQPTCSAHNDPNALLTGKYRSIRAGLDTGYHGMYSVARQQLQDGLLDDAMCSIKGGKADPWIVFTAGAMGSGKSRTFDWLTERGIVPLQEIQILDPDMFKASLPEWNGYIKRDKTSAGALTRRESGYLLEIAQESALRQRKHIWVDGSLRDGEWYSREFERIQTEHPHYKIAILHVVASREKVMERVAHRAAITGRHVPEKEIDDSIARVPRSVALLAPLVSFLAVVDNSGEVPHLVQYCDESSCRMGQDEWRVFSARLSDGDSDFCDTLECDDTTMEQWESISKGFEIARRASMSAKGDEWG